MANPLFQMINQNNIVSQFMEFKKNFSGDPKEQVQMLLNSGRVSQEQYNNAIQMAQQLQQMIAGKK